MNVSGVASPQQQERWKNTRVRSQPVLVIKARQNGIFLCTEGDFL